MAPRAVFVLSILAKMAPRVSPKSGQVVLSKEDERPCNQWPLAKVIKAHSSEDGRVRKVRILKADGNLDRQGTRQKPSTFLDRPIHKLVLLVPTEHQGSNDDRTETDEFTVEEPTSQ